MSSQGRVPTGGFNPNDKKYIGGLLITPIQVLLTALLIFPFVLELILSFSEWSPVQGIGLWEAVGSVFTEDLDQGINYNILITEEPRFLEALGRTALISVTSLILEFLLGLGLATLFLKTFPAKRAFFTALLTPMMIMPVVVGYTWYMLLQYTGPVNQVIGWIGGAQPELQWLNNGFLAFFAVVITEVWHWTPLFFLILLSGLNAVPQNPIRAATVLGASDWRIFWTVIMPSMKGIIIIAFVIRGMEVIKLFDEIYLLTRGGPGTATETVSLYLGLPRAEDGVGPAAGPGDNADRPAPARRRAAGRSRPGSPRSQSPHRAGSWASGR